MSCQGAANELTTVLRCIIAHAYAGAVRGPERHYANYGTARHAVVSKCIEFEGVDETEGKCAEKASRPLARKAIFGDPSKPRRLYRNCDTIGVSDFSSSFGSRGAYPTSQNARETLTLKAVELTLPLTVQSTAVA
jgi:hypothetical protein